jgi:hypothetical protein
MRRRKWYAAITKVFDDVDDIEPVRPLVTVLNISCIVIFLSFFVLFERVFRLVGNVEGLSGSDGGTSVGLIFGSKPRCLLRSFLYLSKSSYKFSLFSTSFGSSFVAASASQYILE